MMGPDDALEQLVRGFDLGLQAYSLGIGDHDPVIFFKSKGERIFLVHKNIRPPLHLQELGQILS